MKYDITMYAKDGCSYCARAEALLAEKGVSEFRKLRIDLAESLRDEMIEKTGQQTVPQIYIGTTYVGGCAQLQVLDQIGELDDMIARVRDASI
jgi:glutaredoxin 3